MPFIPTSFVLETWADFAAGEVLPVKTRELSRVHSQTCIFVGLRQFFLLYGFRVDSIFIIL